MAKDCGLGANVIVDMKKSMPSADKLAMIANYLEVSVEYLLGLTDDPTPPKKELTLDEKIAAKYYILTPDEREQLDEYLEFLKIKKGTIDKINKRTDRNIIRAATRVEIIRDKLNL